MITTVANLSGQFNKKFRKLATAEIDDDLVQPPNIARQSGGHVGIELIDQYQSLGVRLWGRAFSVLSRLSCRLKGVGSRRKLPTPSLETSRLWVVTVHSESAEVLISPR